MPRKKKDVPPRTRRRREAKKRAEAGLPPRPQGMPLLYTPELADKILEELITGKTLRQVSRELGISEGAMRKWAKENREGFGDRYLAAREIGYHAMADEIIDIADDDSNDVNSDGKINGEVLGRSRLKFDARRWLLSKALPKVYGDRLDVAAKVDGDFTVKVCKLSDVAKK